jgi:hypothetical protein
LFRFPKTGIPPLIFNKVDDCNKKDKAVSDPTYGEGEWERVAGEEKVKASPGS